MSYQGSISAEMQQRLVFATISNLVKVCFKDCTLDYKSADFSQSERTCLINCSSRHANSHRVIQDVISEIQGSGAHGGAQGSFQ